MKSIALRKRNCLNIVFKLRIVDLGIDLLLTLILFRQENYFLDL